MNDFESFTHAAYQSLSNRSGQDAQGVTDHVFQMFETKGYIEYLILEFGQYKDQNYQTFLFTTIRRFFTVTELSNYENCFNAPLPEVQQRILSFLSIPDLPQLFYDQLFTIIKTMISKQWPTHWPNFVLSVLPFFNHSLYISRKLLMIISKIPLYSHDNPFGDSGDNLPKYVFHLFTEVIPQMPISKDVELLIKSCFRVLTAIFACTTLIRSNFIPDFSPIILFSTNILQNPHYSLCLPAILNFFNIHWDSFLYSENTYQEQLNGLVDAALSRITNAAPFSLPASETPAQNTQEPRMVQNEQGEMKEVLSDKTFSILCGFLKIPAMRRLFDAPQTDYYDNPERCAFLLNNIIIPNLQYTEKDAQLYQEDPYEFFLCDNAKSYIHWLDIEDLSYSRRSCVLDLFVSLQYRHWFTENIHGIIQNLVSSQNYMIALSLLCERAIIRSELEGWKGIIQAAINSQNGLDQCIAIKALTLNIQIEYSDLHVEMVPIVFKMIGDRNAITFNAIKYIKSICLSQMFDAAFYNNFDPQNFANSLFSLVDEENTIYPLAAKTILSLLVATKSQPFATQLCERVMPIILAYLEAAKSGSSPQSEGLLDPKKPKSLKVIHTYFNIIGLAAIIGVPNFACDLIVQIFSSYTDYYTYGLQLVSAVSSFIYLTASHKSLPETFTGNFGPVYQYILHLNNQQNLSSLESRSPEVKSQKRSEIQTNIQQIFEQNSLYPDMFQKVVQTIIQPDLWEDNQILLALVNIIKSFSKLIPQVMMQNLESFLGLLNVQLQNNKSQFAAKIASIFVHYFSRYNPEAIVEPVLQLFSPLIQNPVFSYDLSRLAFEIIKAYGVDRVLQRYGPNLIMSWATYKNPGISFNDMDLIFEVLSKVTLNPPQYNQLLSDLLSLSTLHRKEKGWSRPFIRQNRDDITGGVRFNALKYASQQGLFSRAAKSFRMRLMNEEASKDKKEGLKQVLQKKISDFFVHFFTQNPEAIQNFTKRTWNRYRLQNLFNSTGVQMTIPTPEPVKPNN